MSDVILSAKQLAKTYHDGKLHVEVFKDLSIDVKRGEQVAIIGSSGAGKSTLLHLLGGLDKPSHGDVYIEKTAINALSEKERCQLRNKKLGFIYQLHHLLPEFTALENVCVPMLLANLDSKQAKEKACYLLEKVGLGKRIQHKVGELSGGERQRTAIVRALVNDPLCVFADEPTGNLDEETAHHVYQMLLQLNQEVGTSFIIVTHDKHLAKQMHRVLRLEGGTLHDAKQV